MNEAIAHRGTRSVVFQRNGFTVGRVRLPIQGLDERYDHLPFVGEVVNYKEIDPDARNDAEVFYKGVRDHGVQSIAAFDGFWSAAVFSNDAMGIITDPLGRKPLYVHKTGFISSEVKGLAAAVEGGLKPNNRHLANVAKFGYVLDDTTPFEDVFVLTPGRFMAIEEDGRTIREVANLSGLLFDRKPTMSVRDAVVSAVRTWSTSDVPIGVLLSGGLDSTILFELLKRQKRRFVAFHVNNDEAEFLQYLDFPSNVQLVQVDLADVTNEEAIYWHETPVDLGSVKPQLALAKAIKAAGISVVLSGDGADELFGGYSRAQMYDSQESDLKDEIVRYHSPRLDRMMMAGTIELRAPYLGRDVVAAALALPWTQRQGKMALRDAFADVVPAEILNRAKKPLRVDEGTLSKTNRFIRDRIFREKVMPMYNARKNDVKILH